MHTCTHHSVPSVFAHANLLPTPEKAPNIWAWNPSIPRTNTPADYRRRLLAWAELLEGVTVSDHWDYGSFGDGPLGDLEDGKEELSCGTVACAVGWAFLVPEAKACGAKAFGCWNAHPDSEYDEGFPSVTEQAYYGLNYQELKSIAMAGTPQFEGQSGLIMGGTHDSSAHDVAAFIREIADYKYPVTAPKAPEPAKAKKPKAPAKPGSKRHTANLWRAGIKRLQDNGWTRGKCVQTFEVKRTDNPVKENESKTGTCYCINGAVSGSVFYPTDDQLPPVDVQAAITESMFGSQFHIHRTFVTGPGGDVVEVNDADCRSMSDALAYMRAVVWALEHGGRVSPAAKRFGEAYRKLGLKGIGG